MSIGWSARCTCCGRIANKRVTSRSVCSAACALALPRNYGAYTGMLSRCLRHVDALLAPSAFTAQRHREGGITCPIHVLPTFTTLAVPCPTDARPASRPHFVYVGRLTLSKGVLDLAEQFRHLPQYDLTIAGDGELRDVLRRDFGDCEHIHLPGTVPQQRVVELYQQATALILPCIGPEVFPLVVLEAMACGTPVIVREAGGSAEAVDATGGGVVYRAPEELRKAVQRMAGDRAWRDSLALWCATVTSSDTPSNLTCGGTSSSYRRSRHRRARRQLRSGDRPPSPAQNRQLNCLLERWCSSRLTGPGEIP